ncbi:MAG: efflux RND transporter periplasmic adaptor subunit [Nitrospirae bacterium]|nr:efflux RND transporter periplasmic adaptor subunit [Nitrospirota bacterium]
MKRIFILITALLTLSALSCSNKIEPGTEKPARPVIKGIELQSVKLSPVTDFYETTGTVRARNTSYVASKIMGEVEKIYVKEGDTVKAGDLLLRIKSPDIEAKVTQARQALEEARRALKMAEERKTLMEKTFRRYENLHREKAITDQEFDEIKTKRDIAVLEFERANNAVKRAAAALREAQAFSGYSVIVSPINGVVAKKLIDAGSMATPGTPLFIIEEPRYRVEAAVDESLEGIVKKGMAIPVEIKNIGLSTEGRVSEIVQQVDPVTRTFIVKIDISANKALKGGLFARVRIPLGEKKRLLVPEDALIKKGEVRAVYVVDDKGVVKMRLVRTGKQIDDSVEILSGLSDGETIVVKGLENVIDGGVIEGRKGGTS